ncbi:hypothetical protein DJ568_09255 [Mucilaginibacter hurinus]|uniref:Glycoside hydrolase family 5 domain-containing protein n=1 Tax=Mucilaginibacter hurinus TaxID=2201324 RepID=A0A367GPE9_9SPHI|nr:cellulase family glycosylhydrolase [Mucilaginibacter hurinus]RCH55357.1 hypothetical protein DJ568_09255 [Mucilaginibacter hurinus]
MRLKTIPFLIVALAVVFTSCKKETLKNASENSLKENAVHGYTVHASIRKLDNAGANNFNYEFTFWVSTDAQPLTALQLPAQLQLVGELSAGGTKEIKKLTLQTGTRVTRKIYRLTSPVSVIGKFSVPGLYQGKQINCTATVIEQPYNLPAVAVQGTGFVDSEGKKFIPWGVNYTNGKTFLLMDNEWYDETDWQIIKQDFREMKAMGLNIVRIHLQYKNFMTGVNTPNLQSLKRLKELIDFTATIGLYLDITGLCSYLNEDPAWYTNLDEAGRWATQALFWKAVARVAKGNNNVFCYNLINEPVTPTSATTIWLPGEAFGGLYYYVQHITRQPAGRSWTAITSAWISKLKSAIREEDNRTLVTVGFIGLGKISYFNDLLDYNSIHIYPKSNTITQSLNIIKSSQSDKPLVVEETSWEAGYDNMRLFINTTQNDGLTVGYMAHYHGETIEDLEKQSGMGPAIQREWYKIFMFELNPNFNKP